LLYNVPVLTFGNTGNKNNGDNDQGLNESLNYGRFASAPQGAAGGTPLTVAALHNASLKARVNQDGISVTALNRTLRSEMRHP